MRRNQIMNNDFNDRRNSRVAILVVAVAVMWALWKFFQKISGRALGLVATSGTIYYGCIISDCGFYAI